MTTRSALATALSTVDGVTGHEYRPNAVRAGDAWPLAVRYDYSEGQSALQVTWHLFIVLTGDERAASARIDALVPDIPDALQAEVFVDTIEPITVQTSGGDLFALQITARSES